MSNDTMIQAILWIAALGILLLLIMRRRKRKMQS